MAETGAPTEAAVDLGSSPTSADDNDDESVTMNAGDVLHSSQQLNSRPLGRSNGNDLPLAPSIPFTSTPQPSIRKHEVREETLQRCSAVDLSQPMSCRSTIKEHERTVTSNPLGAGKPFRLLTSCAASKLPCRVWYCLDCHREPLEGWRWTCEEAERTTVNQSQRDSLACACVGGAKSQTASSRRVKHVGWGLDGGWMGVGRRMERWQSLRRDSRQRRRRILRGEDESEKDNKQNERLLKLKEGDKGWLNPSTKRKDLMDDREETAQNTSPAHP
ncbi:hypothetical protein BKA70DRAFT_1236436 [Coprinopsis sp. MPI-PUGE-AT-0042]|nr:hypothetical protein BKA70DRAFT_1236436 [Coprinopsis sp. MPI-PUGE-AT-0042]